MEKKKWECDNEEWLSDVIERTMNVFMKKQEATKLSYNRTFSLIEWAKIAARIIRRRVE